MERDGIKFCVPNTGEYKYRAIIPGDMWNKERIDKTDHKNVKVEFGKRHRTQYRDRIGFYKDLDYKDEDFRNIQYLKLDKDAIDTPFTPEYFEAKYLF